MPPQESTVFDSVVHLIDRLKNSESAVHHDAAGKICQRYAVDLLQIARRQLERAGVRHREDEEDVMQSVFRVLASGDVREKYKDLNSREELWKLLVTVTKRRASSKIKHHKAAKRTPSSEARGGGNANDTATFSPLDHVPAAATSPESDVISALEVGRMLEILDEPLRKIVMWKLEGYTNEEIAGKDKTDCAVRTVERKLERIRGIWEGSE